MKDGKLLYEAEKFKRESFGKLFSKYLLKTLSWLGLSCHLWTSAFEITFLTKMQVLICYLFPFIGKSFLRNRLFKGLDSWPPTSFCVSYNFRSNWKLYYHICNHLQSTVFQGSLLLLLLCRHESPEGLMMNFQISQLRTCSTWNLVVLLRCSLSLCKWPPSVIKMVWSINMSDM